MPLELVGVALEMTFGIIEIGTSLSAKPDPAAAERLAWNRRRALASLDLLVLAAYHDGVITPHEHQALVDLSRAILKEVHLTQSVEELVARWTDARATMGSEEELVHLARHTAQVLQPADRQRLNNALHHLCGEQGQHTLRLFQTILFPPA